ncbi:uncharacterized protein LOC144605157 [Rhinoraja longicauda]
MGCGKMAVRTNMAGQVLRDLLDADSAEVASSEQPKNENQSQMDLYDDLINDIIGVPLNNGIKPNTNICNLRPNYSSNNITLTTTHPRKATPPKYTSQNQVALSEKKILLIGNLTWWTTADDLASSIRSAGIFNVDQIRFYEVPKSGQSKGFARVDLSADWDIKRLLEMLPKKKVHGRVPDVRRFNKPNRQYFEKQFINAMEKSKLHSAENDIFDGYDGNDNQSAFDSSKETIQGDPAVQDQTLSPFVQPVASTIDQRLQPGSTISPNFVLHDFISLGVSAPGIPALGLGGCRHIQTLQTSCTVPATFYPPFITSLAAMDHQKPPAMFNPYSADYRILGREADFQVKMQSQVITEEFKRTESILTTNDKSKDDSSEDFGSLLRLVSFVKKSKSVVKDNYTDTLNCPANQRPDGETKKVSSGLREHEYSRHRENRRSGERSGSVRDRSRSPCSSDGHYQENKMDYNQEKQKNQQRLRCEYSPRKDHHSDRSRDHRDSVGQERACDSTRYPSRNIDSWHGYSENIGKGQDYSQEKYFGIKQDKDRKYQF